MDKLNDCLCYYVLHAVVGAVQLCETTRKLQGRYQELD